MEKKWRVDAKNYLHSPLAEFWVMVWDWPRVRITIRRGCRGMTLLEITIVAGLLALLAAIAMSSISRPRTRAQIVTCLANLRQLENVKQQWAVENGKESADIPSMGELRPYFRYPVACPVGGSYTINSLSNKATCTIAGHTLE